MMILLAVDCVTHAHGIVMLCSLANKIITATLGATIASLGLHSINNGKQFLYNFLGNERLFYFMLYFMFLSPQDFNLVS